jgi:hypothetical protein
MTKWQYVIKTLLKSQSTRNKIRDIILKDIYLM